MISCNDRRRMKVFNIVVMIIWSGLMSYVDGSCDSKGDIVFLLDNSENIGYSNFERVKSFVSTIVGRFSVANDTNQFSVVNFDSSAREIFPLNQYQTVSSIQSAISNMSISNEFRKSIENALYFAGMFSFTNTTGARTNAAKIVVLITDGESSRSHPSEYLKAMGVTIFCVGVGPIVQWVDFRSVASHNDYTYLTTYDLLHLIAEELSNRTCADDINDCLGEPCLNGGTCEDQFGKYVCHCQGGNTDPNCYVPGLPNVTIGSSVLVSLGSRTTLFCYVTSTTPVSSITWLYQKNGVTSVVNTVDTLKYTGGTVGTPSLSIINVQLTDVGNYRCQAQNTAGIGHSESMISLELNQELPYVVTGGSYFVNASSNVTLTCNFTSSYPPVQMIQWYKYDSAITTGLTEKYIGGTLQNPSLTITDFQLDDQGVYNCLAFNSYGKNSSFDFVAYLDGDAPVAFTGPNMTGMPGETLIIPCSVGGSISRVFWTFQSIDLDLNEAEVINTSSKFYWSSYSPSLRIYSLSSSDLGFYRCCANSSSGLGRSTPVYVTFRGMRINVDRTTYSVNTGDDVTLSVSISSEPKAYWINWIYSKTLIHSYYYHYTMLSMSVTSFSVNNTVYSDVRYDGGTDLSPSLDIRNVTVSDAGRYHLALTNVDGMITSIPIDLNVDNYFPIIAVKQQNFSDVYTETTVRFELNVTSQTPVQSVRWEKSNTSDILTRSTVNITDDRILGGTIGDPSITISNVSVADTGYYLFTATNVYGPSYMGFLLNVTLHQPIINLPKTSYTAYLGSSVTLEVNITFASSLTDLFWERRNASTLSYSPIAMSDNRFQGGNVSFPSLTILDVNVSDEQYYRMQATNQDGTIVSSLIYLSVNVTTNSPTIYLPKTYYTAYLGSSVTLEVNITFASSLTDLFWERRNASTLSYSPIDMSDNRFQGGNVSLPSLTILDVNVTDEQYYRMQATNQDGTTVSSLIYLSVNVTTNTPIIYLPKISYTAYLGSSVTLEVNITFASSLTDLFWERRNASTLSYSPIDMSDNRFQGGNVSFPSLTILDVNISDEQYYRMQATNQDGTIVSSTIYVNVTTRPPVVSVGMALHTVATRASFSLQVNYTSGPEMKSISWEKGTSYYFHLYVSVNITAHSRFTGGTLDSPSLEINDAKPEDSGYYRCRVTNNDGTTTTPVFTVLVQKQLANINMVDTTYSPLSGDNVTIYVTITDSESNSTITWERQGENEASFNVINTQTNVKYGGGTLLSPSLTIYNITGTDVGYYRCKVTNIDGTTTSSLIYIGLKSDSSCDKLSCGGLRECVLMNNKPTCSLSTWKAAAVVVAGTVGAAASVAAGVAAFKLLSNKAIKPLNGNGNSQGSNSNSNKRNNRNNNDNNDHNSDNNSNDNNSDDDNSDRESNHDDDLPDSVYVGGFQGVINSMPPPSM